MGSGGYGVSSVGERGRSNILQEVGSQECIGKLHLLYLLGSCRIAVKKENKWMMFLLCVHVGVRMYEICTILLIQVGATFQEIAAKNIHGSLIMCGTLS